MAQLDVELTERCNNNCAHCYINLPANDEGARARELSTEEWKSILAEAASLGCLTVRFTGGEPLLREDFPELYLAARKLGLRVILFTNGTLITSELAGLFAGTPPLRPIEVSVYGMKKETCETTTRTSGSFEAALRGIDLLKRRQIPFVVKGTLLPHNREEADVFMEWASRIPWMKSPPVFNLFLNLHGRRDESKNRLIRSLRPQPAEGILLLVRTRPEYATEMETFCSRFLGPTGAELFSCGAGMGSGCADAYGHFHPCVLLKCPQTSYNLHSGSLRDALESFFPAVRRLKARNPRYLHRCARCSLRGLCDQCPAHSWLEEGSLDAPVEYLCGIAHSKGELLGLLQRDTKGWEATNGPEQGYP